MRRKADPGETRRVQGSSLSATGTMESRHGGLPLAERVSAKVLLSLGFSCQKPLVSTSLLCVFQATSHLLRTTGRTLAFAELCVLPPSFQRLQSQALLFSSPECPWPGIHLSLQPYPALEHTSGTWNLPSCSG